MQGLFGSYRFRVAIAAAIVTFSGEMGLDLSEDTVFTIVAIALTWIAGESYRPIVKINAKTKKKELAADEIAEEVNSK